MRKLLEIADVCEWFPQKAGKLGAWLIVPLIIVIMYDITTRKLQFIQQAVLNSPLYDKLKCLKNIFHKFNLAEHIRSAV